MEQIRSGLNKKQTFLSSCAAFESLLLEQEQKGSNETLSSDAFGVIQRIATLLRTRYTDIHYWRTGRKLFNVAERFDFVDTQIDWLISTVDCWITLPQQLRQLRNSSNRFANGKHWQTQNWKVQRDLFQMSIVSFTHQDEQMRKVMVRSNQTQQQRLQRTAQLHQTQVRERNHQQQTQCRNSHRCQKMQLQKRSWCMVS